MSLATELKVEEKDRVAIHQYEIGLVNGLRRAVGMVRITNRTTGLVPNREWNFTSLHEISQIAIQLETSFNSRNDTSTPSTNSRNPFQSPLANPTDGKRKADKETNTNGKTSSAEGKRFKKKNKTERTTVRGATVHSPPPQTARGINTKAGEGITCFRCRQIGHYARNCPQRVPANEKRNNNNVNSQNRNEKPNKQRQRAARGAGVQDNSQAKTTNTVTEEKDGK